MLARARALHARRRARRRARRHDRVPARSADARGTRSPRRTAPSILALGGKPGAGYETSAWEWRFRAAPPSTRERAGRRPRRSCATGLAAHPGDGARSTTSPASRRAPGGSTTRSSTCDAAFDAAPGRARLGGRGSATSRRCASGPTARCDGRGHRRRPRQRVGARRRAGRRAGRGATTFLDLGDTLDGPLDPVGTADRLLALGALTVRGNHDRMMVERRRATAHALLARSTATGSRRFPTIAEHEDIVLVHGDAARRPHGAARDAGPGRARASARSTRSRRCSRGSTRR